MLGELWSCSTSKTEELRSEPYFLHMCLMVVLSDDLFNCEHLSTTFMLPKPDQTKASSTQQFNLLVAVGKPISEYLKLLFSQIVGVCCGDGVGGLLFSFFNCHNSICFIVRTLHPFTIGGFMLLRSLLVPSMPLLYLNPIFIQIVKVISMKRGNFYLLSFGI